VNEDQDFARIAAAWRELPVDSTISTETALGKQHRHLVALLAEIAAGLVGLVAVAYFWLIADGWLNYTAGAVILSALIAGYFWGRAQQRRVINWSEWTPEGILRFHLESNEVALRNARAALVACAILILFALFLWIAEWTGSVGISQAAVRRFGAAALIVSISIVPWSLLQRRAKKRERSRIEELIRDWAEKPDGTHE
jgi:hypothetical protein